MPILPSLWLEFERVGAPYRLVMIGGSDRDIYFCTFRDRNGVQAAPVDAGYGFGERKDAILCHPRYCG